jgi:hypothetical protein
VPFFPDGSGLALDQSRRLFGQPEWIANADVSFDQLDWGTKVTLAYYAISDVLDAAGTATIGRDGSIVAITLDRYVDSYDLLDLVILQEVWGGLGLKFTAKNLINSKRRIIYDPAETSSDIPERSYRVGRDYSIEIHYTFSQLPTFGLDFLSRE